MNPDKPAKNSLIRLLVSVFSKEYPKKAIPVSIQIFDTSKNGEKSKPILSLSSEGHAEIFLPKGVYKLRISQFSGIVPIEREFRLEKPAHLKFQAETWFDFRKRGLFCGDCHNHVNFPEDPENLRRHLLANGVDYLSACQGWLTPSYSARAHDGAELAAFMKSLSCEGAEVRMGAEYPKTRFGHICWWKFPEISDPFSSYNDYHDGEYFKRAGFDSGECLSPSKELPFASEAPMFKLVRWKKAGGVSMAPHPTSWWRNRDDAYLVATNISADFCFDLLSGRHYDSFVAMGYDAEQIFYQNLWFRMIMLGYKISGVAETDGGIRNCGHFIGSLRSYVQCRGKKFRLDSFLDSIKSGSSFMTSGPILIAEADGKSGPGASIVHSGGKHEIKIEALSAPDKDEYISWIVLYRNGRPFDFIDIEDKKLRRFEHVFRFSLQKGKREWFVVKIYGRKRPLDKSLTDILSYAELCEKEIHTEYRDIDQVAFTNPFYFEPPGYKEPEIMAPPLKGRILDESGKIPISGASIKICDWASGQTISCVSDAKGAFALKKVSLLSELQISAPGCRTAILSVYMHYPPLVEYFERIYSGRWAAENRNLQPGQVPWSVFDFEGIRKKLSSLDWEIRLKKSS